MRRAWILTSPSEHKFAVLSYIFYFAVALLLAFPTLSYYWFGDDLILIRPYSNQELITGFTGNWDPTGFITPGWRPLSRLFYHIESVLFGGTIEFYRLLAIALFALHITLLMVIARELKLSRSTVLVAGVIIVCTKNTWWMTVWLTDSLRGFMGIFGSLAILLLIHYLKQPARRKFLLSLLCYVVALLTREEILFYAGMIPAVAFVFLLQRDNILAQSSRWRSVRGIRVVLIYMLVAMLLTAAFWVTRSRLIPQSPSSLLIDGFLFNLIAVLFPHLPSPSVLTSAVLVALFWIVLLVMLRALEKQKRWLALFWLGCVLVACTPGLSSWRANNLLLPIGFFALFIATVVVTYAQRSRSAMKFCVLLLAAFIVGSAVMHRLAQETLHPYSLEYIRQSDVYLWGQYVGADIPPARIDHLWAEYRALGINNPVDYEVRIPQLYQEAERENRQHPDGEKPFSPYYPAYFHPW